MSKVQTIDQTDIICGLKAAVTALECQHNMQLLKKQKEKKDKIDPAAVHVIIPMRVDAPVPVAKKKSKTKTVRCRSRSRSRSPRSRSRSRSRSPRRDRIRRRRGKSPDRCRKEKSPDRCKVIKIKDKTRLIFPEMRGGVLYSRCCCLHRDGLQDHCPLSQCQGKPECLTRPWATCPPGKFVRSRYPELYPKPRDCVK